MAKGKKKEEVYDVLNALESAMESQYGAGSAIRLSSDDSLCKIDRWVSTGSMVIDKILAGGRPLPCSLMPFGRMIELAGYNGSGKTTLSAQIAANVQQMGGLVVVIDAEERVDEPYWRSLNVDTTKITTIHARTLEEAFEKQCWVIEKMQDIAPGKPLYLLWDSLGSLSSESTVTPGKKGVGFMEAAGKNMGRDAKTISSGVKMVHKLVAETDTLCVYTNHMYKKVGVTFGSPDETYGGEKYKFFCTVRLKLTAGASIIEEDQLGNKVIVGKHIYAEAMKNSMAPCLMKKQAVILGGTGFSNEHTVLDVAKKMGWINTRGAWSTWLKPNGDEVKFQGNSGFLSKVVMDDQYDVLYQMCLEVL